MVGASRKRSANFSSDEVEVLTSEVAKRSRLLFAKLQGPCTSAAKERGWTEVAEAVTAVSSFGRTKAEVKKKWCVMKSAAKSKAYDLKEYGATGGGGFSGSCLSSVEYKIVGVMGEVCVAGLPGGIDTSEDAGLSEIS